ncbi:hypothetical protein J25TS5_51460 [Paenibacillus faecis]|uniref:DUF4405 domain-containing protein n=1 Tax=Paenibacillus faecis TaxID=862114 RepID=UPI001B1B2C13|nr:DUF4405 domain-containing protein [Paenibacillus faecis]GIO88214.1 hypothetical protein J25TS5_51460 [Paenibacillus faecis]
MITSNGAGKETRKKSITYFKFGLDLIMALTFVLFFNKQVLGGLTFHEMAGIGFAAAFLTHMGLNWRWIVRVTSKLFDRKLPLKTKFSYLLNLVLLLSMTFVIVCGLFISRVVFPALRVGNEPWFKVAHMSVAYLVLILVAVHIGLHWKWVVGVFQQIVRYRMKKPFPAMAAKLAAAALLVFGCYQIYTSNFAMHLRGVAQVAGFSTPSVHAGGRDDGRPEGFGTAASMQSKGEHGGFDRAGREGGFEGRGGGAGPNVFGVVGEYLGIMSVFIIIVYYLDQWLLKRNAARKKRRLQKAGPASA